MLFYELLYLIRLDSGGRDSRYSSVMSIIVTRYCHSCIILHIVEVVFSNAKPCLPRDEQRLGRCLDPENNSIKSTPHIIF